MRGLFLRDEDAGALAIVASIIQGREEAYEGALMRAEQRLLDAAEYINAEERKRTARRLENERVLGLDRLVP